MPQDKVLILRTCTASMTSYLGFVWPESGPVEAPDWEPTQECGHGLHGWLWGEGYGGHGDWDHDAKWLVVEVDADSVIDLNGKVKFPRGVVVHCGDRVSASAYLAANGAAGRKIIGGTSVAGHGGTAAAGYRGTAATGDHGTATAEIEGTTLAGDFGSATAGDFGFARAGCNGTASAGREGTAAVGPYGSASAGVKGTALAAEYGTASAGKDGVLLIPWWDVKALRRRFAVGYVGEDGIEPGVRYRLDETHRFVPVKEDEG